MPAALDATEVRSIIFRKMCSTPTLPRLSNGAAGLFGRRPSLRPTRSRRSRAPAQGRPTPNCPSPLLMGRVCRNISRRIVGSSRRYMDLGACAGPPCFEEWSGCWCLQELVAGLATRCGSPVVLQHCQPRSMLRACAVPRAQVPHSLGAHLPGGGPVSCGAFPEASPDSARRRRTTPSGTPRQRPRSAMARK